MKTDIPCKKNTSAWADSVLGRYILSWEQEQIDAAVADLFGYHAVQIGLPELDGLRNNRMAYRGLAFSHPAKAWTKKPPEQTAASMLHLALPELPFATQSIDLLILPHTLESTEHPHHLLREVERVLLPEGKLIIFGFNPFSLWGIRNRLAGLLGHTFLPTDAPLIELERLKDWLSLLGLELELGRFGCYRLPAQSQSLLDHFKYMEAAGDRWWPICGAIYMLTAIKRVRALSWVGPAISSKALPARPAWATLKQNTPLPYPKDQTP